MHVNFHQNRDNRSVITVHTNLFAKEIEGCMNLQLPDLVFKNSTLSDIHQRKTYIHIHFQQSQVSRSIKTVHTNLHKRAFRILNNHASRICTTL